MNDSELKHEELAKKSIIVEFSRYFDKFPAKVGMESVDTKATSRQATVISRNLYHNIHYVEFLSL